MQIMLTHPLARPPTRNLEFISTYDLFSARHYQMDPMDHRYIDICIKCKFPEGMQGIIHPRASLSALGLAIAPCIIQQDKNLKVQASNLSDCLVVVNAGDCVAQMVMHQCETPAVEVVESFDGILPLPRRLFTTPTFDDLFAKYTKDGEKNFIRTPSPYNSMFKS